MGAAELRTQSHFRRAWFKSRRVCSVDMYLRSSEFCTVDTGECVAEIMGFIYNHHLQRHTSVFTVNLIHSGANMSLFGEENIKCVC